MEEKHLLRHVLSRNSSQGPVITIAGKKYLNFSQRHLLDLVFLHRDNPVVQPFFEWQTSSALTDSMREPDIPSLLAMVTRHEGAESARLAAYWFARQPQGVLVFRDTEGGPAAFQAMVGLHDLHGEDLSTDPAVQSAGTYLQRYAPLRPGESATLFRFWMVGDTSQAVSRLQSPIFIYAVRHYLTTPGLAFTFLSCAQTDLVEGVKRLAGN